MIPAFAPVLLVDDEADDRFLFAQAWSEAGASQPLVEAESGAQALALLSGPGPAPALLLTDIKMPRVSGLELLERLRRQPATRRLPVIILTASTAASDRDRAYELGANSFLVKPSSLDELVELVRVLDAYWLRRNEYPSA